MCKFRGYDKYEVFEDGRIWSYKRNKWLKPTTRKDGYQRVCLVDNEGKQKWYYLHRIVWETFSGSPIPEGYEINHISETKDENFFANLELMSHKENINFGKRTQKCSKAVGAYKNGELVMTFKSTAEAGRQGFNQGNICACCRNFFNREGNNVYKGYSWKYL